MARLITNLTPASALTGAELAWVEQGGLARKATTQDIANLAPGGTATALSTGTRAATTYGITSDGGVDDVILLEATTTLAGLLGSAKWNEIVANTAKVTNATHTGDVTGSVALTVITAGGVAAANLLDKSATETVSGAYSFTSASRTQGTGLSTSWGATSGAATGAFNTVMGVSGSATWLLSGTSGGTFRGGIQLLDSGVNLRLYANANYVEFIGTSINVNGGSALTTNTGTVTSVSGTGTINGLTLSGTVTTTGNLTLGGSLSGSGAALTALTAANISGGNLGSGVLPYVLVDGNALNYKIPYINHTGTTSGNYALFQETTATFTYNPSTNVLVAGTFSGSGASLTGILESAITDSTILARVGSNEVVTGAWSVPSTIIGKTASYTLIIGDAGQTIRFTGATASKVCTIPANASVAFPIGTLICVINDGTVVMTVAITTDTMTWAKDNTTGTRTIAAGGELIIHKTTATTWKVNGSALVT